jgi:hypothetical protein
MNRITMNRIKPSYLSRSLFTARIALVFAICMSIGGSLSAAVVFNAEDVQDSQILFAYNGLDNRTYINGISTGKSFASSGATVGGIGRYTFSTSGFLAANSTNAGTYSFSWDFEVPDGYEIMSASLTYRLVSPSGSGTGHEIDLDAAVDDGASFRVRTFTITNSTNDTGLSIYTFPVDTVSGATSLSIAGTVILGSPISQAYTRMFPTATTGAEGSAFVLALTLQSIPEPSVAALLAGGAGIAVAVVRRRKRSV